MRFQAIWPVTDPSATDGQLIGEAIDDIKHVATRHGARLTGEPKFMFMDGRHVPGSGGAERVLVAQAPCEQIAPRPYRHTPVTP